VLRRLPLQNLCNGQLSNQRNYKEEEEARRRQGESYMREGRPTEKRGKIVRMYGFKLEEGGEWFKEGFRKLLSQE